MPLTDAALMDLCLHEAKRGARAGEVPVGALVINPSGAIVARAHNLRETTADPTAHAEIVALREAARALGHWRLIDHTLVVTLEPCPMCAGALVNARLGRLVFGCTDPKAGAIVTCFELVTSKALNHRLEVLGGVRAEACAQLLRDFFLRRRG